jgi:hypothetical protein
MMLFIVQVSPDSHYFPSLRFKYIFLSTNSQTSSICTIFLESKFHNHIKHVSHSLLSLIQLCLCSLLNLK